MKEGKGRGYRFSVFGFRGEEEEERGSRVEWRGPSGEGRGKREHDDGWVGEGAFGVEEEAWALGWKEGVFRAWNAT